MIKATVLRKKEKTEERRIYKSDRKKSGITVQGQNIIHC